MPAGKKRTVTIFISYAREDAVLATALQDELLRVFPFGVDVIVDTRSIKPGDDFRIVLDKKLDSSDILLIRSLTNLKQAIPIRDMKSDTFLVPERKTDSLRRTSNDQSSHFALVDNSQTQPNIWKA
jgi:hypothetical protein